MIRLAACRTLRVRCVVWLKRMQGAARSQWLFRWGRNAADAVATRNPEGRTAFWHSADWKVKPKPSKSNLKMSRNDRQKDFRRTREESPTGC